MARKVEDTPRAIVASLRAQGIEALHARCVARVDCEVWRVSRRGGGDLSLRIYRASKDDRAPIDAEMAWLLAAADDGLHVQRPLPDAQGCIVRAWQPDEAAPARHAVLLTWLGGRMHDRGLTPARLRRVGAFTGRLHELSAALARAGRIATSRLAEDTELAAWAEGARPGFERLAAPLRRSATRAARELARALAALPRDAASWGFVHGDLHPWNLLFARDQAGAIDFSDCGWGLRAFDLASTLQWLRHPLAGNHDPGDGYAPLQEALFEGYASTSTLPQDVERQVDLLIAARLFMTLEWMLDDWATLDERPWGAAFLAACPGLLERAVVA